ncbi:MAG TPA: PEGA domain-containing protein [Phycisphaerae bacterium]|nr:PEGA domain-containing protein [Phycisphaerales bacterium]HRX86364.1 PEGA domain-containing protein [Phycisphaerae bacterium]
MRGTSRSRRFGIQWAARGHVLVGGAAAVALLLAASGCVRRTVTINTVPQGATVWLNDEEVGKTPVDVDFLWYGDYDVTARLAGYETLHTHQNLTAPWYQVPGIDFFSEVLWPGWIHDERSMNFAMIPAPEPDREQLLRAAEAFRTRTLESDE